MLTARLGSARFVCTSSMVGCTRRSRVTRNETSCAISATSCTPIGGEDQDEFAASGEVHRPLDESRRQELVSLAPRVRHSPVIRELPITAAHSVTYRNFPTPEMYAEVISWRAGEEVRWTRADGAPPEDTLEAQPTVEGMR